MPAVQNDWPGLRHIVRLGPWCMRSVQDVLLISFDWFPGVFTMVSRLELRITTRIRYKIKILISLSRRLVSNVIGKLNGLRNLLGISQGYEASFGQHTRT